MGIEMDSRAEMVLGRTCGAGSADMEDLKASERFLVLQKPMIWHTETLISGVNTAGIKIQC
ncbi:hypothetical protein TRIUR3_13048 [Triticum urartu]|uniref:Uncharacterized protein n=2 Tax=Triticum urartu TaxID=4572 RepID=M7ZA32_TRIUA|nr:hypothetical protein TRIUR3_13048 [Triticum urartu]